ncbi:MAG: hypothetical protein GXP37_07295 [Chloroflexi bacterium]|nr:hypothetical protein [Chloroflexota bacterium]
MRFQTWHRYAFPLLFVLYVLLAVTYSLFNPIFEAPDEHQHTFFIQYLIEQHRLPVLNPETARPWHEEGFPPQPYTDIWAQEGGQPPLYYLLGALLVAPLDTEAAASQVHLNPHANIGNPRLPGNKNRMIHTADEAWPWHGLPLAVHVLRLFSVLLGLGTLLVGKRLLQTLFPRQPDVVLAALALTAFNPQFLFISSAVSNDNLIILLATWVLYQLVTVLLAPPSAFSGRQALGLGAGLGLALLSKLSGLSLLGVVLMMLGVWGLMHRQLSLVLRRMLVILLVAAGLGGWWYVRNQHLYGDATALQPFLQIVGKRSRTLTWDHLSTELQGLRVSFLAVFGWFNLLLPAAIYRLWDVFLAMSSGGWLVALWRRWRRGWRPGQLTPRDGALWALVLWIMVLFISLLRWISLTPGAQGRLLFPALLAINLFLLLGWRALWPSRPLWMALPPAALLVLALISPFAIIRPAYQPPPTISPAAIPATARLADPIEIDGRVRLLGVDVTPTTLRRGEIFHITLYWQATAPIPYDASLFVHLLGQNNQSFGGIDSYPGWGTAPTSQWTPGAVLVDSYETYVPWEVVAPTLLKLDIGMFDYVSKQAYARRTVSGQDVPLGLATLRILPRRLTVPTPALSLQQRFGDAIELLGVDLPADSWRPGDEIDITFYWQTASRLPTDYQLFVQLLDADGHWAAGYDLPAGGIGWPTSAWEPRQPLSQMVTFPLPADLHPGIYTLITGLYRLDDLQRLPASGPRVSDNALRLGTVTITR